MGKIMHGGVEYSGGGSSSGGNVDDVQIDGVSILDNRIANITTMEGATTLDDGEGGLVPAPESEDIYKFLRGDGQWSPIQNGVYIDDEVLYEGFLNTSQQTVNLSKSIREFDYLLLTGSISSATSDHKDTSAIATTFLRVDNIKNYSASSYNYTVHLWTSSSYHYFFYVNFPTDTTICINNKDLGSWTDAGLTRVVGIKCLTDQTNYFGVFPDYENLIETVSGSSGSASYTATEDCFVVVRFFNKDGSTAINVKIDDVLVGGTNQIEASNTFKNIASEHYLKKGQIIEVEGAASSNDNYIKVYGLQSGSDCNFRQPVIYSEDEQEIGLWTDGKPLYQKTYNIVPTSSSKDIDVSSLNIEKLIARFGSLTRNANGDIQQKAIEYRTEASGSNQYGIMVELRPPNLHCVIESYPYAQILEMRITIQYTKTTDSPGSGHYSKYGYNYNANYFGVFPDFTKVIVPSTSYETSMSYTAVKDCFVYIDVKGSSTGSGYLYIDNNPVGRVYSSSGSTIYGNTYYLKRGQTITSSSISEQSISYTVYDLQSGSDTNFFQPIIYSGEEREVGVWVNGKPIYQKTIDCGMMPNDTSWHDVAHNVTDMDSAISIETIVISRNGTDNQEFLGNVYRPTVSQGIVTLRFNQYIKFMNNWQTANTGRLYATIRYTKTTDQPGSAQYTTLGTPAVHYDDQEKIIGTFFGDTLYEKSYKVTSISGSGVRLDTISDLKELVSAEGCYKRIVNNETTWYQIDGRTESAQYNTYGFYLHWNNPYLNLAFTGYSSSEIKEVIVKAQYTKTS